MVEMAKQKNIKYTSELEKELSPIYGSRDWFKQLMLNLIDNAIKYTPEGGRVKVTAYQREKNIFISVKDTGIGIPKKDIPRLFERFYRVDKARSRKVGGTGLGLAIVKHIVIAFEGEIKVKSEEGKGTEFLVRIPI
jgi:two-component system phosphate regulon sensor histidine kinase PhoR